MLNKPRFNIVLNAPDIPGNTGSIGRTCLALGLRLILIKPYGFEIDEKAVRRAGLDYWKHVDLVEYDSWDDFMQGEKPNTGQMFLFSKTGERSFYDADYQPGCYLIFGSETTGLPPEILSNYSQQCVSLPMFSDKIRSLNLSNAATAAAYEALRRML